MTNIAIENGDLECIFPLKRAIFHSYVKLPEGTIPIMTGLIILIPPFSLVASTIVDQADPIVDDINIPDAGR